MSGRLDYEERKERRIERYQEKAVKARKNSDEHYENYKKMADAIPLGQPILVDHYSANATRNGYKKMHNAMDKSVEENKKADYYEHKIDSIENNKSISADDPEAIKKLEEKLQRLEEQRKQIKAREHKTYELTNLGAEIRRIKERIKQLKELEEINFEDILFNGGKIIHNKDANRIQIIFDEIPGEEIRTQLKENGFKWARSEGAWQRLFNKNTIYVVNRLVKSGVFEVVKNEKM